MIDLMAYSELFVICPKCGGNGDLVSKKGSEIGGAYEANPFNESAFIHASCRSCNHKTPLQFATKNGIKKTISSWKKTNHKNLEIKLPTDRPIIANLGMGVDSVSMIAECIAQGIKLDIIIFSDTGGEKESTYRYKDYFNKWLIENNYPNITEVSYKPVSALYSTLEGNCLQNQTLPSLAFNKKSCSVKFKAKVMDDFLLGKGGVNKTPRHPLVAESLSRGMKPVKLIGYDNGPADSRRAVKTLEDDNFLYEHPLRQLKWDREDCVLSLLEKGLAVPSKSACFFCPASKKWELYALAANEPEKFLRAIKMEDTARHGKHGLTTINGLWSRDISWREWSEQEGIINGDSIVMPKKQLIELFVKNKPMYEANVIPTL